MGSGHGWAGVTQVLWNCRVRRAAIQNPWVSGNNYSIGTKGEKVPGHFKDRPEGIWEGQNEINIFPVCGPAYGKTKRGGFADID